MSGWAGKILSIDLTKRSISSVETAQYGDRFIGGLGIGEKIYWDRAPQGIDAFDPANPLIIMTGPLAGTRALSAPRLVVCGKSPCVYPETFVSASLGGFFAADIKKAGYDGVVVQGKADKPVYISINDDKVEIKDASHLWGLTNGKTREIIQEEFGGKPRILSIGPGAENPTRIGIIFADVGATASMGFGSVMGSKNLKAIAAKGSGKVSVTDSERISRVREKFQRMKGEGYFNLYETPLMLPDTKVIKKVHCHGCPQGCWRTLHRSPSGAEDIRKCQIGIFYAMWDQKRHGQPTEASFRAATLANDYSLCVLEVAFLFLWLERCFEQGIISEEQAELPLSQMGTMEFLEAVMKKISYREGFGEVLAEGARRASEVLGEKSRNITKNFMTEEGRAVPYGPKVFSPSAIIYATEPRPFITELHGICEPLSKWALWYTSKGEKSYVSTDVLRKIAARFWGGEKAVDFSTYEGKALAARNIQNRQFAKESLVLCDFAWPVYDDASTEDHVGDPTLESQLLSAVTGRDIGEEELYRIAERIFALNRAILLKEGRRGREDDRLVDFMFVEREEPVADVFGMHNPELLLPGAGDDVISRKGKALDRDKFEEMKDEYYGLRGWDVQTGLPKKETLEKLELSDVAEGLQRMGKLS